MNFKWSIYRKLCIMICLAYGKSVWNTNRKNLLDEHTRIKSSSTRLFITIFDYLLLTQYSSKSMCFREQFFYASVLRTSVTNVWLSVNFHAGQHQSMFFWAAYADWLTSQSMITEFKFRIGVKRIKINGYEVIEFPKCHFCGKAIKSYYKTYNNNNNYYVSAHETNL